MFYSLYQFFLVHLCGISFLYSLPSYYCVIQSPRNGTNVYNLSSQRSIAVLRIIFAFYPSFGSGGWMMCKKRKTFFQKSLRTFYTWTGRVIWIAPKHAKGNHYIKWNRQKKKKILKYTDLTNNYYSYPALNNKKHVL